MCGCASPWAAAVHHEAHGPAAWAAGPQRQTAQHKALFAHARCQTQETTRASRRRREHPLCYGTCWTRYLWWTRQSASRCPASWCRPAFLHMQARAHCGSAHPAKRSSTRVCMDMHGPVCLRHWLKPRNRVPLHAKVPSSSCRSERALCATGAPMVQRG